MHTFRFIDCRLYVNEKVSVFNGSIIGLIGINGLFIVLTDESSPNNVYAVNQKGEKVWQIQDPKETEYKDVQRPYVFFWIDDDLTNISVVNSGGLGYKISINNGKIIASVWTK